MNATSFTECEQHVTHTHTHTHTMALLLSVSLPRSRCVFSLVVSTVIECTVVSCREYKRMLVPLWMECCFHLWTMSKISSRHWLMVV